MIHILLKYILWYVFVNNLDAQNDFEEEIVTKIASQVEPFFSEVYSRSLRTSPQSKNRFFGKSPEYGECFFFNFHAKVF